ncbi:hypothetical protein ILUMI_25529 [Ignelater luminosus]|uniref:Uncharacterized protein n=1 Tax=Ignelater luminosus TaxID=2038154 RepID=A0A8K0FW75_IGNLU|nr:hypothetical protein ILUMI_25529 [Ignelater luminosus]
MLDSPVEYLVLLVSVLCVILMKIWITPENQPIFNVYRTPNSFYWPKVLFMYIIMSLRKLKENKKKSVEELDRPQKLSYHDKAVDAVYFNAGNAQGDYLVTGTARRKNKLIDGFLFLKVASSNLGVLETPKVPCTSLYKTEDNDEFSAEGLKVTSLVPMKKWKINYDGLMKETANPKETHNVQIDVEWTSNLPHFSFDTDIDILLMAKCMALEPWSREYFEILKDTHQDHYEQFGELKGTAIIDGKKYDINLDSCRDHSFGKKREWEIFHRYGLHYISAENGDRFAVCSISAPIMFSSLTLGFVYSARDKKNYPIQSCDLKLYQHGEGGDPPTDYAFSIVAGNKDYTIQVNIVDSPYFYISKDWECKVIERLCTAEINGKKGWGVSEWEYRNVVGKKVAE